MKNSNIAQLNKAYSKRFKAINKNFFVNKDTGLILFIEYLKYLRDVFIIKTANNLDNYEYMKTKIATLTTTIAEFETYTNNHDKNKKNFHWNNFCEFIKLNMEDWLETK
jgi:hypothetical protein